MLIVNFVIIKVCFKLINFRYSNSTKADLSSDTSFMLKYSSWKGKNSPKDRAGKKSLSQSMRFTGTVQAKSILINYLKTFSRLFALICQNPSHALWWWETQLLKIISLASVVLWGNQEARKPILGPILLHCNAYLPTYWQ